MKPARYALLAALAALALADPAGAATYGATASPGLFSFSASEPLTYRLQITTAEQPERLEVRAAPPAVLGGGTLMQLGAMRLEGPGTTVFSNVMNLHGDPACQAVLPVGHGSNHREYPRMQVDIPANSTSTIELPATPRSIGPLWPGLSLAVDFEVGAPGAVPQVVRSPSPANVGLHGVPISFQTQPRGHAGGCPGFGAPPVVTFGKDIVMSGRAYGAVAGQLMTIRAAREGDSLPHDIATVKIDKNGFFGYRWRPPAPGAYSIGAHYRSQARGLADDFSPATTLRVAAAAPAVKRRPVGIRSSWHVLCRRGRCSISGGGTIMRGAGATKRCTGEVRLRVAEGRKRLLSSYVPVRSTCRYRVTRRFRLRSSRTRSLLVRAAYLYDEAYLPRTSRAVRIRLGP